jgi:hypothetical protein
MKNPLKNEAKRKYKGWGTTRRMISFIRDRSCDRSFRQKGLLRATNLQAEQTFDKCMDKLGGWVRKTYPRCAWELVDPPPDHDLVMITISFHDSQELTSSPFLTIRYALRERGNDLGLRF